MKLHFRKYVSTSTGVLPWLRSRTHLLTYLLLCSLWFTGAAKAQVAGTATTAGQGQYKDNLLWLDLTGYSDATARSASGQNFSIALPDGSTLSFNLQRTAGSATGFNGVAAPTWSGAVIGAAVANGAYSGIPGRPFIYGGVGNFTFQITNIQVKDSAGNARPYTLFVTDAESTGICNFCNISAPVNVPESLTFTTNGGNWQQVELLKALSGNAATETLAGVGSTTATWTGTSNTDNGSVILSTANPTTLTISAVAQGTAIGGSRQGAAFGIMMPKVTLTKALATTGRANDSDQFKMAMAYDTPSVNLGTITTTGSGATIANGTVSLNTLPSVPLTLSETMAVGSASPLASYLGTLSCSNARAGSSTSLPSGTGTSFNLTPAAGDLITCTLTNVPTTANLWITKTNGSGGTLTLGTSITYQIVVHNDGPDAANNAVLRDPAAAHLACTTVTCGSATGGAVCPAVSIAALQSAGGVIIPTFPPNSALTFMVTCTVN